MEELKAERTSANWSWKQKSLADLNAASAEVRNGKKELDPEEKQALHLSAVDKELSQLKQNAALNLEKMRKAQDERDREMELFLSDIKNTINEDSTSDLITTDVMCNAGNSGNSNNNKLIKRKNLVWPLTKSF